MGNTLGRSVVPPHTPSNNTQCPLHPEVIIQDQQLHVAGGGMIILEGECHKCKVKRLMEIEDMKYGNNGGPKPPNVIDRMEYELMKKDLESSQEAVRQATSLLNQRDGEIMKLKKENMSLRETLMRGGRITKNFISELEDVLFDDAVAETDDYTDEPGDGKLHEDARNGRADSLKHILSSSLYALNLNITNKRCLTPLHLAARNGKVKACDVLIRNGAAVEPGDKENNWTPLHFAAFYGKVEVVKCLTARHSANIICQDKDGRTPFDLCESTVHVIETEKQKMRPFLKNS
mmetsp:Transcript_13826/g.17898  ORF Transcript_13826/g.17898 Transcript_13826/m.17898 type:complete len:290 (+) Transcript_13826:108-977(+)